jgi:chromosome segregation ATPase
VLATAAALLLGCGGPTTEQVQTLEERVEELEAAALTAEATEELEARLTEVEDGLDQLRSTLEPATLIERADATDAELARLVDGLSVLEEELAILGEELAEVEAELSTATSDLRAVVDGVRSGLDEVRADNDELRALIVTVRDRLDRCQADGSC